MPTFSFGWHVDRYQTSNRRKEETRPTKMTTPMVPSFWQPTCKIGKKGAKKQREHLVLHTNTTNEEEPMPTVWLIVSSVQPNAEKQTKWNKNEKETEKPTMPTFSFAWRVDQYQTSNQKKEEARPRKMTTPTVPSFRQPTRKIGKKGAAKQRGHLILHTSTTNEEPMLTVRSIVSLVEPNTEKQKKGKEKEKMTMPTFSFG